MAIEALKSVGAVYQASSTPEIAKEVSQPKTQILSLIHIYFTHMKSVKRQIN